MLKKYKNKYLKNIIWLLSDIFIKIFLSLGVSILTAKYMGVEVFGLYSYLLSIFSIFILVSALGMNGVVVKELVDNIDKGLVLGSSLFLQRIGVVFSSIALIFWMIFFNNNVDEDFLLIFLLIFPTLILQSSNIFKYWFEYKVQSKYIVISQVSSIFLGSVFKVLIIYFNFSYLYILFVTVIEQFFMIFLLKRFFLLDNKNMEFKINLGYCKYLLSKSWPLIISGLSFVLYMRIDQIMIGEMIDMKAVGLFSAVVRLVELSYFIPTILVSTFFSMLVEISNKNQNEYNRRMQLLYDFVVVVGFFIFILTSMFSEYIIKFTFGSEYYGAADQLKIYSFVCIFYFLNSISGRWYINAGLQKIAIFRNLLGLLVSIFLNAFLIPIYGISGASISTVIAFIFSSYLYDFFDKRTRVVFYQKTKALLLFGGIKRLYMECFQR